MKRLLACLLFLALLGCPVFADSTVTMSASNSGPLTDGDTLTLNVVVTIGEGAKQHLALLLGTDKLAVESVTGPNTVKAVARVYWTQNEVSQHADSEVIKFLFPNESYEFSKGENHSWWIKLPEVVVGDSLDLTVIAKVIAAP